MATTVEHYEQHLAPVYAWMAGGVEAALARGRGELAEFGVPAGRDRYAADLGAGFGMHSIPLAQQGCRVLAIDTSARLLRELTNNAGRVAITTVRDDLLRFTAHLRGTPDLVLCMGDTLTHLPDPESVTALIATVARQLAPGGRFLLTFRDYSQLMARNCRFIPVRSDATRILNCCLEYTDDRLWVTDILQEWTDGEWRTRSSSYCKLRLAPVWVVAQLEAQGFVVETLTGAAGMMRLSATRTR